MATEKEKLVPLMCHVTKSLANKVKKAAKADERSVSKMMAKLLDEALKSAN